MCLVAYPAPVNDTLHRYTVCIGVLLFLTAGVIAAAELCELIAVFPEYRIRVAVCEVPARAGLPEPTEQELQLTRTGGELDEPAGVTRLSFSRVFDGGNRALHARILGLEIMYPFGSRQPVLSVRIVTDSHIGGMYSGARTVETQWFLLESGSPEFITWFVEETDLGRTRFDYVHAFVRNGRGEVTGVHQYAVQSFDGVDVSVDRTTRRISGRTVTSDARLSRQSLVEPVVPVVYVRAEPGRDAPVFDALTDQADPLNGRLRVYRVRSIAWHEEVLYYEVLLGRGGSGWVPADLVRWIAEQPVGGG